MAAAAASSSRDNHDALIRYFSGKGQNADGVVEQGRAKGMSKEDYLRRREEITNPQKVTMLDARVHNGGLGSWFLEEHGFCMIPGPAPETNFRDKSSVMTDYIPRALEAVRQKTGAKRAVFMSHALRTEEKPGAAKGNLAYADFAHIDFGLGFEPLFRRMLVGREGWSEEEAQGCELMVVTLWQPFDHPAYKDPFCLLDCSSVHLEKETVRFLNIMDMGYNTKKPAAERVPMAALDAPSIAPAYSQDHRWVFCPDMTPQEAWLFKQYDYRRDAKAKCCFHISVPDPFHDAWKECPGRRSIETRILLTFDKNQELSPAKL